MNTLTTHSSCQHAFSVLHVFVDSFPQQLKKTSLILPDLFYAFITIEAIEPAETVLSQTYTDI